MLSLKTTTALIAAISVIATASAVPALIPQAFAQNNNVTAFQSNSFTADIDQKQNQFAYSGNNDNGDTTIKQSADQGFCLQSNQQNVAAGDDAIGNDQVSAIVADDGSKVDCS